MMNDAKEKMATVLLQSLYDYHFANNGGSYTLPKAMANTDPTSKSAIEYLIEKGFATDSGQGTDNLVLSITPAGMEAIKNQS